MLLESIIDYSKDGNSVTKYIIYVTIMANRKPLRHTTVGWKLFVKFRYVSEQWVPLKTLKETDPIEVSEFATDRDIVDDHEF